MLRLADPDQEQIPEQRLIRIRYTGTTRSTEFRYDCIGRRTAVVDNDGTTAT